MRELPETSDEAWPQAKPDQQGWTARAGCGCVGAGFLAWPLGLLISWLTMGEWEDLKVISDPVIFVVLTGGFVAAFATVTIFGLPAHLLLRRLRLTSLRTYAVTFFFLGCLVTAIMLIGGPRPGLREFLFAAAMASSACACGMVFWYLARPDIYKRQP